MAGNLDGSGTPTLLFNSIGNNPFGIDVDVEAGKLYWTEFVGGDRIITANADGTGEPTVMFSGYFGEVRGIAAGTNIHIPPTTHEHNLIVNSGWNMIGYSSFDTIPLVDNENDTSGLYLSGFAGGESQSTSDRIMWFDGVTWRVMWIYEGAAHPELDGRWYGYSFDLAPREGYWLQVLSGNPGFNWTYDA